MQSVPSGALTNVLIREDFHLKEIPIFQKFDHPKIGIFAKEKKLSHFANIRNFRIFLEFLALEKFWR